MIEIQVNNLVKSFEVGKNVLDGLTFQVDQGERVGLLGRNGAGKTTLFKILTGELDYDEGTVVVGQGRRVGLISQIPVYPAGCTVEDVLRSAFARLESLAEEMRALEARMAAGESDPAILKRYGTLSERFEAFGGYDTDVAVNKIANGLSIPDSQRSQLFDSLSGGEKTRVNLGRLILEDTDILLLDEPTNHLDLHATEWLEEYIRSFHGTVVTISHDRYFLDRTVTRVIEIQDGKAEFYSGNYSFYAVEKERRYQERMKQYEKEQAKIAQLEKAAEQLRVWAFMGMDKTYRRAISMERRIERMRTTAKPTKARKMDARFSSAEFHGDEVLGIRNVSKSYGDKHLFEGISLKVEGGERIALIGDNGAGKTTFLRLVMNEETPDIGWVQRGPSVRTAYLPQIVRFAVPERSMLDTMLYECKCTPQEARDQLGAYGFCGEDVLKPVSALSGGELSRLRLCMLMRREINFLILDEPTNHLDIASREWIEDALSDYTQALLFVSHDRYFIEKFATRIWLLENGTITDYRGTYEQFREYRARQTALQQTAKAVERKKEPKPKPKRAPNTTRARERTEREIEKLEGQLAALDAESEANATDYQKLMEIDARKQALNAQLEALYEAWEALCE